MKARDLLAVLMREPLNYEIARQRGSHRRLKASGRPPLTFAFHDRVELGPAAVRKILCKDIGLEPDEALKLL
jgi:predicted RNA binding protein YcfA (HicA-like mRNA interferase family)